MSTEHAARSEINAVHDVANPLHCTVVLTDVANFTDRDNHTQLAIRHALYQVLGAAFEQCGLHWLDWHCEDRGDGVLLIVPAEVSKALLLGPLPVALSAELEAHNAREESAVFRVRLVVHAGDIVADEHGWSGPAINLAARLLDASVLGAVLARSAGPVVLAVSQSIYDDVVRQNYPGLAPISYQATLARVKRGRAPLWIRVPGHEPPLRGVSRPRHRRVAIASGILAVLMTFGMPLPRLSHPPATIDVCDRLSGASVPPEGNQRYMCSTGTPLATPVCWR